LLRFNLGRTKKYGFSGQLYDNVTYGCPSSRFSGAMQIKRSSHLFAVHFPASVGSLTGAGDCLVGGTLASICSGLDVMVLQIIAGSYHLIKAITSYFSDFCLVQTMQGPYIRPPKFCFMNQCFSP